MVPCIVVSLVIFGGLSRHMFSSTDNARTFSPGLLERRGLQTGNNDSINLHASSLKILDDDHPLSSKSRKQRNCSETSVSRGLRLALPGGGFFAGKGVVTRRVTKSRGGLEGHPNSPTWWHYGDSTTPLSQVHNRSTRHSMSMQALLVHVQALTVCMSKLIYLCT